MSETSAPDRGLAALRRNDRRAASADFRRHFGLVPACTEQWLPVRDTDPASPAGFCVARHGRVVVHTKNLTHYLFVHTL